MDKKLTWREVFDCTKLFPLNYSDCKIKVRSVGYRYMCFNSRVYDVYNDEPICEQEDLQN